MLANRAPRAILSAALERRHYIALQNMVRRYPRCAENLWRYLTGKGTYPYDIQVRTPTGLASIQLHSHHDLLTVNEIFCREDYVADSTLGRVVDIGSNIGVSALYFLTRNSESTCVLYEPDPKNIDKLAHNLRGLESRFSLVEAAVSDRSGQLEFGVEQTGRYGGLGLSTGHSIIVTCVHINDALISAMRDSPRVAVLKIDTEGVEEPTVRAIHDDLLRKISRIYLEARPKQPLHPELFANIQYGSVRRLIRKFE